MMIQSPMPFGADLFELADALPSTPTHSSAHRLQQQHYLQSPNSAAPAYFAPRKTAASSSIDHSKLKTKLCRHYLMGLPCPFEARCAFAHGEEQLVSDRPSTHSPVAPAAAAPAVVASAAAGVATVAPMSRSALFAPRVASVDSMPPPPSYHVFVNQSQSMSGAGSEVDNESPRVSRPPSPPAYPTRFRYEPYSPAAIVFQA